MSKVRGDGPHGYEEHLRDLAVREPLRGELRDTELTRGEGLYAADALAARLSAGGDQLLACASGDREGAAPGREVEAMPERLAGIATAACATQRGPVLGPRAGELNERSGPLEKQFRLGQLLELQGPRPEQSFGAERDAERERRSKRAGEADLLGDELLCAAIRVQACCEESGL